MYGEKNVHARNSGTTSPSDDSRTTLVHYSSYSPNTAPGFIKVAIPTLDANKLGPREPCYLALCAARHIRLRLELKSPRYVCSIPTDAIFGCVYADSIP